MGSTDVLLQSNFFDQSLMNNLNNDSGNHAPFNFHSNMMDPDFHALLEQQQLQRLHQPSENASHYSSGSNGNRDDEIGDTDYTPSETDVICQRGRDCQEHAGNRRLMELVKESVDEYVEAKNRQEKSQVISNILNTVNQYATHSHGGFIMRDSKTKKWHPVGPKVARDKVGNALRDLAKERQLKFSTKKNNDNMPSSQKQRRPSANKKTESLVTKNLPGNNKRNLLSIHPNPSSSSPLNFTPVLRMEQSGMNFGNEQWFGEGDNTQPFQPQHRRVSESNRTLFLNQWSDTNNVNHFDAQESSAKRARFLPPAASSVIMDASTGHSSTAADGNAHGESSSITAASFHPQDADMRMRTSLEALAESMFVPENDTIQFDFEPRPIEVMRIRVNASTSVASDAAANVNIELEESNGSPTVTSLSNFESI